MPTVAIVLGGCTAHDESLGGHYRLLATDSNADMIVCYEVSDAGCVGRIGPTVVSVGSDSRYIVAEVSPADRPMAKEFYYLVRADDSELAEPSASVRGPFDKEEFEAESKKLELPALGGRL